MRLLLLLLVTLCVLRGQEQHSPYLLIFTSEGTYYKLHTLTKHVEWYQSLGDSLLSFQFGQQQGSVLPKAYFIPTLDGHFVFIDAQSQILIDRKEVEQLLRVCFDGQPENRNSPYPAKYFIYEKFEYYIINLNNGVPTEMEKFLKKGPTGPLENIAVLKIIKKYLKQIRNDLTVAWSTISSEIDVVTFNEFLKDPKGKVVYNESEIAKTGIQFRRVGKTDIQMVTNEGIFEIGGTSHIIAIFSHLQADKGFLKHPLSHYKRPSLALEYKPEHQSEFKSIVESDRFKEGKFSFPHSDHIKSDKEDTDKKPSEIQFCISMFRNMQALTDQSKNPPKADIHFHFHKYPQSENASLIFPKPQMIEQSPSMVTYGPTDDQPYVWIALIVALIIGAYWIYQIRINSLLLQFSASRSQTDQRLSEFQQRLGQFEELKKMYEVFWDKLVYQVAGEQWYEHVVFEGRFLNQETFVYAVRLQGTDIVSLEHKLNLLLNFSHKGLVKLYYYTRNSEFLLIFTEKVEPLSLKTLPDYLNVQIPYNSKKNVISQIIESVSYLDGKIEINWLPYQAISVQPKIENEIEPFFSFRLNTVPCLLRRITDDSELEQSRSCSSDASTFELRMNLVCIFHLILHQGQAFDKKKIDELLRNQAYSQDEYLQFFDFILYEARSKTLVTDKDIENGGISESSRELMFKDLLDHPFLWDSKRKILFLSDFSNYIETHIDQAKVKKLESHARDYNVIKTPWIKEFHFLFVKQISNYRKYDFESVRDLIRVIRNKLNHFHQIPKEVRSHIGKTPEGFIEYCLELFPKLLHFAYVYTRKKKWKLHMK